MGDWSNFFDGKNADDDRRVVVGDLGDQTVVRAWEHPLYRLAGDSVLRLVDVQVATIVPSRSGLRLLRAIPQPRLSIRVFLFCTTRRQAEKSA